MDSEQELIPIVRRKCVSHVRPLATRCLQVLDRGRTLFLRNIRKPGVYVTLVVLATVMLATFVFLWSMASNLIDQRLASDDLWADSGVYATPLTLRVGQPFQKDDLVGYLQRLGYESGQHAPHDGVPGCFVDNGDTVIVEPMHSHAAQYHSVAIRFGKNNGIAGIVDRTTGVSVPQCALEPIRIFAMHDPQQRQTRIEYEAIPDVLRDAIVSAEDRRFWDHNGVDYLGIVRAARDNWEAGRIEQGGSTITQQLVKNLFLTSERTYTRKIQEVFLAWVLEWKFTKEEIFALYCNEIYFGQVGSYAIHGAAEASQRYFHKDLSALTVDEAALLAGLIRGPNALSPFKHPDRAIERRNQVLDAMVATGSIAPEIAERAKAAPLDVQRDQTTVAWLDAPYFCDYLMDHLDRSFADPAMALGHTKIESTLDLNLQRAAREAVDHHLARLDDRLAASHPDQKVQVAVVAIEPRTGAVVALVGGRDYQDSQLNRATSALRQPGSVFKPFVYAAAIESGLYSAATPVLDAPRTFVYGAGKSYQPENYGESYTNADVPVRVAFRKSKNVPTVEIALRTGLSRIGELAADAGLPKPDLFPSMALGASEATPLEIAASYSIFANKGYAVEPTPVLPNQPRITPRGSTSRRVISPQTAYVLTNLMQDVVNRGTGASARALGVRGMVAGKTGTSRDGWFVGYSPDLICAVWVGFDDGSQLGLTGAASALPIWAEFMRKAAAFRPDLTEGRFERPDGVATAVVCDESGLLAGDFCPSTHTEIFTLGTVPVVRCDETTTHSPEAGDMLLEESDWEDRPDVSERPVDVLIPPVPAVLDSREKRIDRGASGEKARSDRVLLKPLAPDPEDPEREDSPESP